MDTAYYKKMLEEEKEKLETELSRLGSKNPSTPNDWDVKAPEIDILQADENEAADRTEEMHIDSIVLDELELRYRNVAHALNKIEDGTYGVCEISGEQIEEDRLRANPAARTCKAHLAEGDALAHS